MKHIVLACAGGMSTSLLMQKMLEAARAQGEEVDVKAMSVDAFAKYTGEVDVLLLGPQMGFRKGELVAEYGDRGFPIGVVDMMAYGMMDGATVLKTALELIG